MASSDPSGDRRLRRDDSPRGAEADVDLGVFRNLLEVEGKRPFTFLLIEQEPDCRAARLVADAYRRAFTGGDEVCLLLVDPGSDPRHPSRRLVQLAAAEDAELPSIEYYRASQPVSVSSSLLAAGDALIVPLRDERLPRSALAAMRLGIPVILPKHHGWPTGQVPALATFVDVEQRPSLRRRLQGVADHERMRLAVMSPQSLRDTLRAVFRDPRSLRRRAEAAVRALQPGAAPREKATSPAAAGMPADLSVCMIVRNEERWLADCLASLRGIAGEVIVVDTGSSDASARIARDHGAQVFRAAWKDDFAAARNESLRHARHSWILVVDADERLDPASRGELREICRGEGGPAYWVRIRSHIGEVGAESSMEHALVRLFPNRDDIRYDGSIHEQLAASRDLPVRPSGVLLHHLGYGPDQAEKKAIRNLRLLEAEVERRPSDGLAFYHLGVAYADLGRLADAEQVLRRSVAIADAVANEMTHYYGFNAWLMLARVLAAQQRFTEAIAPCRRALTLAPQLPDAWMTLGALRLSLGRGDKAISAYCEALQRAAPDIPYLSDGVEAAWRAALGLAQVYQAMDSPLAALECLETAMSHRPEHAEVRAESIFALQACGYDDEASELIDTWVRESDGAEPLLVLAGVAERRERSDVAEQILRRRLDRCPRDASVALALARLLRARGNAEAGANVLRRCRSDAPDHRLELAHCLIVDRQTEAARRELIQFVRDASDEGAMLKVGNLLAGLGFWEEALEAFHAVARARAEDPAGFRGAARALFALGCHDEAHQSLAAARLLEGRAPHEPEAVTPSLA